MSTRQWKRGCVVVKNFIPVTTWVALKTRLAVVHITIYTAMLLVHVRLVVFMTTSTAKLTKITAVGMTIRTTFPFSFVLARIDWKKLPVMIGKSGWFPVRTKVMAFIALRCKPNSLMVWIEGLLVVSKMAAAAFL